MVDNPRMKTLPLEYPQILLTHVAEKPSVPRWMVQFSPRLASSAQVRALDRLPELTVVQARAPQTALSRHTFLRRLATQLQGTPAPAKVVFFFESGSPSTDAPQLFKLLTFFDRAADVEFACGRQQAAFALNAAFAKIWAQSEAVGSPSKAPLRTHDPLAELKSVIAATADLRGESGRLSASRVADALGLPVAELASLVGRNRQTVSKTPEAEALQPLLAPFERVARLRSVLPQADFRRWLNMGNEQVGGASPREVMSQGRVEVVADLVQDMLSGSTT